MKKAGEPKQGKPVTKQRIPPLPGGLVQDREGIERCGGCGAEVIVGRRIDGTLVSLSTVFGHNHQCVETNQGRSERKNSA